MQCVCVCVVCVCVLYVCVCCMWALGVNSVSVYVGLAVLDSPHYREEACQTPLLA